MKVRVFIPADGDLESARIPRGDEVEVILPASRVLFARLKLPRVSASTIRELLPFAVEDRLLGDPSNIHAVAGKRSADGETTVAVVDRDWFGRSMDTLRRAGLKPVHAWCESDLAPHAAREWCIAWGPERGLLVDDDGVAVAFDRTGDDVPLAVRLALDEAAARGTRPNRICVHAESGQPFPDLARWSADASVTFMKAAEPWEKVLTREPARSAIDLLQGEFAPGSVTRDARRIPRSAVVIAAIILAVQVTFVALDAWRLERERQSLEARREAIFRGAFPEAKAVVDPDLQMRRNVAELKRTRGLAGDDDFLAQLTRAAREGAPVRSLEYASGRLQVKRDAGAPR